MSMNFAKTEVKATLTQTSISPSSSSICAATLSSARGVGDVDVVGGCSPAAGFDLGAGAVEPGGPAGQQGDRVAACGELLGAGAADAAGGAGHDDDALVVRMSCS